jgi:malonate transporter and related proteins
MLSNALLILSDFALIALGFALRRFWPESYHRGFWTGAEKLVYYLLFPALLFNAINRAQFSLTTEATVLGVAVAAFFSAVLLGFAGRWIVRPAPDVFASCVQTAFRYNSYIGLALAYSLLGARGVALLALVLGVCIPLANVFAVYALARHAERGLLRELASNPLILATVSGLVTNLLGWKLPTLLSTSLLDRLGSGGLALGLLCIGAGLTLENLQAPRRVIAYFTTVKLALFPAIALGLAWLAGLRGLEAQLVVLFAALPTASTAYVLAARMGGQAAPVAFTITLQTLLSVLTLPLWVSLAPL